MSPLPTTSALQESSGLGRYLRAAHYLAGAQIYLRGNVLLREPLRAEHVKDRLLGHWGTCPGINIVYAHLNRGILGGDLNAMLITGPGHGAPANLANLYLEGSLRDFYPELTHDAAGLENLVREFSWPGGFSAWGRGSAAQLFLHVVNDLTVFCLRAKKYDFCICANPH